MQALFPALPSIAAIKTDIKSRPARWGTVLVVLFLMIDLLSVAAWMTPAAKARKISVSPAAAIAPAQISSSGITGLVDKLQSAGVQPSLLPGAKIEREPFTVPAALVGLDGDSLQVFEYGSEGRARREAEHFLDLNSQDRNAIQKSWLRPTHLYISGSMLVLYAGNRENIVSALNKAFGAPFGTA